jgi:hypothetical protein
VIRIFALNPLTISKLAPLVRLLPFSPWLRQWRRRRPPHSGRRRIDGLPGLLLLPCWVFVAAFPSRTLSLPRCCCCVFEGIGLEYDPSQRRRPAAGGGGDVWSWAPELSHRVSRTMGSRNENEKLLERIFHRGSCTNFFETMLVLFANIISYYLHIIC